jgi:hypothetical protein
MAAGRSMIKTYTLRQLMKAVDPVDHLHNIDWINKLLGHGPVCDMTLEDLFTILLSVLHSQSDRYSEEQIRLV